MSEIAVATLGSTVVSCAGPGDVSEQSLSALIEALARPNIKYYLAGAVGAVSMSSTQRNRISVVLREQGIESIAIIDHRLVRGIVTAISWLGIKISAFAWSALDDAVSALTSESVERRREVAAKLLEQRAAL